MALSIYPGEKQYAGYKVNPTSPLKFEVWIHDRNIDPIYLRRLGFYRADWQTHDDRISPAYFDVVVNWDEISTLLHPGSLKSYFNTHPNVSPHYDLLYDMPNADKISQSGDAEFESKVMTITFNDADVTKSIYEIRLEFGTNSPPEMVSLRTDTFTSKFRHTTNIQYLYPPTTSFKSIHADQYTGIKVQIIEGLEDPSAT